MQDDDSLGDYFRDVKAIQQQKREQNRLSGAEHLTKAGIQFTSKNDGAHLIITHANKIVDYWPGTGKFIFRNTGERGRGIFRLLQSLGR